MCVYVCVHVDFLFFFLPEMVNKVEYLKQSYYCTVSVTCQCLPFLIVIMRGDDE